MSNVSRFRISNVGLLTWPFPPMHSSVRTLTSLSNKTRDRSNMNVYYSMCQPCRVSVGRKEASMAGVWNSETSEIIGFDVSSSPVPGQYCLVTMSQLCVSSSVFPSRCEESGYVVCVLLRFFFGLKKIFFRMDENRVCVDGFSDEEIFPLRRGKMTHMKFLTCLVRYKTHRMGDERILYIFS